VSAPRLTEGAVTALLRERHNKSGNGGSGEHAFLAQVRNAAGFDSNRSFDAVAMNLWPSRGLTVEVFEIKVSRSDWLRELKKPDKAEDACRLADKFTIVAPAGCVRDGELPPTWGLIEVRGDGTDESPWKLRTVKVAPLLHEDPERVKVLPRGFVVGMLRCAPGAVPGGKVPTAEEKALRAARQEGLTEGIKIGHQQAENQRGWQEREQRENSEQWLRLCAALRDAGAPRGIDLCEHVPAVVAALNGASVDRRVERLADQLERMAADLRGAR
jgi:hypothetical protein